MNKELLTIKFEYYDVPKWNRDSGSTEKTITIGIFDTFEEAAAAGNEAISTLSELLGAENKDRLSKYGFFGNPVRSVSNYSHRARKILYRVEITPLVFDDLHDMVKEAFEARKRYQAFKREQEEEENE